MDCYGCNVFLGYTYVYTVSFYYGASCSEVMPILIGWLFLELVWQWCQVGLLCISSTVVCCKIIAKQRKVNEAQRLKQLRLDGFGDTTMNSKPNRVAQQLVFGRLTKGMTPN